MRGAVRLTGKRTRFALIAAAICLSAAGCNDSDGGPPEPNPFLVSTIEAGAGGFLVYGTAQDRFLAENVATGGDINLDGFDDLVISSASSPGKAFVVFGKADTNPLLTTDLNGTASGFTIASGGPGAELYSVAIVGDVNGDGLDDIGVGAPLAEVLGMTSVGVAFVIFGKTDTATVDVADIAAGIGGFMIVGTEAFSDVGWAIDGAGDVNGDGLDDVVIGAKGSSPAPRGCYVIFGKTSTDAISADDLISGVGGFAILGSTSTHVGLGRDVSGAGDVNGDGLDDVILGDEYYLNGRGSALVVFGKASTSLLNADDIVAGIGGFAIFGTVDLQRAGTDVSEAGDTNGDGLDDILIGAVFDSNDFSSMPGAAYLVYGKATTEPLSLGDVEQGRGGLFFTGSRSFDSISWVSAAGDLNHDGLDDVLIHGLGGSIVGDANAGATFVVYGTGLPGVVDLRNVAARQGGFVIGGAFGAVAGAGDINGDGTPDVVIGVSEPTSGRVYAAFLPPIDPL